mmetsp:Transcript_27074/g.48249  ORF Transcript_27074/g.48249 Transcript_27074/m.48249 type:complete len:389 (-) Transcript_27074:110-1276(-)
MASVKNWEAQAKTNSILASSLKSLEARVDDLATLMEWRAAVDGRFDEIAETFLSMEDHIEELRNDLDENSVELKLQMEKVGKKAKAGIFGSMFMSRMSFKSRPGEGGGDADGDVGGSLRSVVMSGSQEYGARDGGSGSQRHPQRKREGAKSYVKRNWLKLSIWTLLVLQFVIAVPYIVEPFIAADVTARFMSGTLGLSLLCSTVAGLYAASADYAKDDYHARKTALLGFLSLQTWVIAVGAMHMQASAREAVKLEQYCDIQNWSSVVLGLQAESGCDRDRYWAQLKVLFGMCAVATGLLLTWCFMALRAKLDADEITNRIPKIMAPMLKRLRPGRAKFSTFAKSQMGTQNEIAPQGPFSSAVGVSSLLGGSAGASTRMMTNLPSQVQS